MRKNIFHTIALTLIAFLTACNPIDSEDYIKHIDAPVVSRAVLIEDFTGQKCYNCPNATNVVNQLVEDFGEESIIAVCIHTLPDGFSGTATNVGLMNEESKAYGQYWNVNAQPLGIINRLGGLTDYNSWMLTVHEELQKYSPLSLSIAPNFNSKSKEINIAVDVTAYNDIEGKLQLWLVEDGITAMQRMPTGTTDYSYVHNHVFRATINGMFGDDIKLADGKSDVKTYEFILPENCKAENCSVVAFIYNDKEGVLQAVKSKLKMSSTE